MKKILTCIMVAFLVLSIPMSAFAKTYTVQRGDTLWGIGRQQGMSVSQLKSLNGLKSDIIYVGQKLSLDAKKKEDPKPSDDGKKSSKTHVVKRGDTLWEISNTYGVSISTLQQWNNLHSHIIYIGQKLTVAKGSTGDSSGGKKDDKQEDKKENKKEDKTDNAKTHTVSHGEYLYLIASKYGVSVQNLIDWNALSSNILYTGQTLVVQKSSSSSTPPPSKEKQWVVVHATNLNFRSGAGTGYKVIGSLNTGDKGEYLGTKGDWFHIVYNGKKGYIHRDYANISNQKKNGKTIALDPGHGGSDKGAPGRDGVTYEHDVNYAVALKTKSALEAKGYDVILTRGKNSSCLSVYAYPNDLQCRVDKAKNAGADLFISIHSNASDASNAYGSEVFYNDKGTSGYHTKNPYPAQSKRLASILNQKIHGVMKSYNRGIKDQSMYVNRKAKMPSVLIELGFLTNANDLSKLKNSSVQTQLGNSIAQGVDEYYGW